MSEKYRNKNLLYVEDDVTILENYCFVLQEKFQNIYTASNYDEALRLFNEHEIHMAIIDIKLNGYKTGIDIVKGIRDQNLNTKIIITSAYSTVENLLTLSSLNLTGFLVKPISNQQLKDTIDCAIKELDTIKIIKQDILSLDENYQWDFSLKELKCNNKIISLTKVEKQLLQIIFSNPSIELTYDFIISNIWDYDDKEHHETLRTLISRVRKKLPKNTIKTLYNIGYRYL